MFFFFFSNNMGAALGEYTPPFEEQTDVKHFWLAILYTDHRYAIFEYIIFCSWKILWKICSSSLALLCVILKESYILLKNSVNPFF